MIPQTLQFHDVEVTLIDHEGHLWVTAQDVGRALGYSKPHYIHRLFKRRETSFSEDETSVVNLTTPSGIQETRVFSIRGVRLLAMLAETPKAEEFRRWVLDVLDNLDKVKATSPDIYTVLVRPSTQDEALASSEIITAQHNTPADLRPVQRAKHVLSTRNSFVPLVNKLLATLSIPIPTLAKLREACKGLPFQPYGRLTP
jgi:prophage antirepressor-like protein